MNVELSFNRTSKKMIACLAAVLFAMLVFTLAYAGAAEAAYPTTSGLAVNVIYGGNSEQVANYSIDDLAALPQVPQTFSSIDNLPAPVVTAASGPLLDHILDAAIGSGNKGYITSIAFVATDGFSRTISYSDLTTTRYYYPRLVSLWDYTNRRAGAGTTSGIYLQALPMLAIESFQTRFPASDSELSGLQDTMNTLRFCYGQTAAEVTSTTNTTRNFVSCVQAINITVNTDYGITAGGDSPAPALSGSYVNAIYEAFDHGEDPVLTFTDDPAWRAAVVGSTNPVYVDGISTDYSLASGTLTIEDDTLAYGPHEVKVTAPGYMDNIVTVIIGNTPPDMATSGIISQGATAEIYFGNDDAYAALLAAPGAIVKVNGRSVSFFLTDSDGDFIDDTINITAAQGRWVNQGGYFYITVEAGNNYVPAIPTTTSVSGFTTNGQVVSPAVL